MSSKNLNRRLSSTNNCTRWRAIVTFFSWLKAIFLRYPKYAIRLLINDIQIRLLARLPPNQTLFDHSLGNTFVWNASSLQGTILQYDAARERVLKCWTGEIQCLRMNHILRWCSKDKGLNAYMQQLIQIRKNSVTTCCRGDPRWVEYCPVIKGITNLAVGFHQSLPYSSLTLATRVTTLEVRLYIRLQFV